MAGILAMRGRGVRSGLRLDEARILDLAPTILHLLGMPVPDQMDGRVLTEALDAVLADRVPWQPIEPGPARTPDTSDYTPEDEEAVRRRLEDLGYLG